MNPLTLGVALAESDLTVKSKRLDEKDLWKARFWQGFQSSAESSLSGGKGKVRGVDLCSFCILGVVPRCLLTSCFLFF